MSRMDSWSAHYKENKRKKDGVGEISEKDKDNCDFPQFLLVGGKMFQNF